jgi:hypothetical protein
MFGAGICSRAVLMWGIVDRADAIAPITALNTRI